MTEIEELLAKLEKLDPETWSRVDKVLGLVVYPRSPLGHYIIQGVIQDAIAADDRFLFFEVRCTSYFDVKYEATIFAGVFEVVDGAVVDRSHDAHGDTPAEALLRAYILALEAEREAGR